MTNDPKPPEPEACALFLDIDGTLVDIEEHPGDVIADSTLLDLLERTSARLNGALALISGRTLDEIDRIFRPRRFAAAGAHGTQLRLPDGTRLDVGPEPLPDAVLREFRRFSGAHEGLLLEEKPAGLSLHYRRAPGLEAEARRFVRRVAGKLGPAFRVIDGKMVLELTPAGNGKGNAIRSFLQHSPYQGRRPVFVGDDVTDEDGFRFVNDSGGLSIKAGVADDSAATHSLADVQQVRRWLEIHFDNNPDRI